MWACAQVIRTSCVRLHMHVIYVSIDFGTSEIKSIRKKSSFLLLVFIPMKRKGKDRKSAISKVVCVRCGPNKIYNWRWRVKWEERENKCSRRKVMAYLRNAARKATITHTYIHIFDDVSKNIRWRNKLAARRTVFLLCTVTQ